VMFYEREVDRSAPCYIEIAGDRIALDILDRAPYQVNIK